MYSTKEDYRKAWESAYFDDSPIPLNIDLELASVCNLECPFCFIADKAFDSMIREKGSDGKSKRRLMPKEMALKIIDQAAEIGVPALKFNWRGESTLHHDYSEIIKHAAKRQFHELLVNTNANCQEKSIDGLMAATKVMVSLDSMVPETYAKMRVGGSLNLALEVIAELVRRKHPNLWVRRVITRENKQEQFTQQVKERFPEGVKVSEHFCFDRNEKERHEAAECGHETLGVEAEIARTFCGYPAQRVVVASSGLCYPCCIDLHEQMPVGNINTQTIDEIWNGVPMRMLRRELRAGVYKSDACKNCQSWMSYKAPQREFVQDREA